MAGTKSLTEAADVLHDHFSARLDADYDEGIHIMADALHRQFGISRRAARQLVSDLEHARTIRFRPGTRSTTNPTGSAGGMVHGTGAGGPGTVSVDQHLIPAYVGSYWQIGSRG